MDSGSIGWIIIVGIVVGLPMLIGLVAVMSQHQIKMAKLKGSSSAETERLAARLAAVEKKCADLQEQVNDAHALLVDERRMLDQKLAQKLAESGHGAAMIPESSTTKPSTGIPVKTLQ